MTVKVLYVEDEPLIRDGLAFILELEGYEVQLAADGQIGWDVLQTHTPDIIITDIKMPRMTGLELITKIRDSQWADTPVIVMSGFASSEWVKQAQDLGVTTYLSKPFDIDDILSKLATTVAALSSTSDDEIEKASSPVMPLGI